MRIPGRRVSVASLAVAGMCILSTALWAGGSGFGDDDDTSEDEGPAYFGFVRDVSGGTLPDAKGTGAVKDRGGGGPPTHPPRAHKGPRFRKENEPKEVQITCGKE